MINSTVFNVMEVSSLGVSKFHAWFNLNL